MFKGIQKVTLVDYPGVIAATVFTGGCNFNCPWCHNRALIEADQLDNTQDIPEDQIREYLLSRKGKIQGVCITGGEPTLWGDELAGFMEWCKREGFLVKLDTNGYLPDVLEGYIRKGLPDFIAMDVKNTPELYAEAAGLAFVDGEIILRSIRLIRESGIRYQLRTTEVPDLVDKKKLEHYYRSIGETPVFQEYRDISTVY